MTRHWYWEYQEAEKAGCVPKASEDDDRSGRAAKEKELVMRQSQSTLIQKCFLLQDLFLRIWQGQTSRKTHEFALSIWVSYGILYIPLHLPLQYLSSCFLSKDNGFLLFHSSPTFPVRLQPMPSAQHERSRLLDDRHPSYSSPIPEEEDAIIQPESRPQNEISKADLIWVLAGLWSAVFLGALDGMSYFNSLSHARLKKSSVHI